MLPARRRKRNLAEVQKIFNAVTVTVGGLYLTTHSLAVTLIGTASGAVVTGWTIRLEYHQTWTMASSGTLVREAGETTGTASDATGGAHDGQVTAPHHGEPLAH
jgi:hypothetical protein